MVALNSTDSPEQIVFPEELIVMVGDTVTVTFIVMVLLFTVADVGHAALLVSTQVIISPSCSVLVEYVFEFAPTLLPFFFHWNVGELPPLIGVATKLTLVPEQIDVLGVVITQEGVT